MDFVWAILPLVVGAGLLLGGAELFTESAVDAARALRLSTLAIGLLFAGAEPEELFTAAIAAAEGAPGIAAGDLVGTNVTIITLALALGAVILPIRAEPVAVRHGLITLLASLPAAALLLTGSVGRLAGVVLVALYGAYVWTIIRRERIPLEIEEMSSAELAEKLQRPAERPAWLAVGLVLVSLALMGSGGHFTVSGARALAALLGISEAAIGLTLVALATSAEMVVLSIVPVWKGHPELTVGGILGSYAYNATLGLGVAALAGPVAIAGPASTFSVGLMLGVLITLLLCLRGGTVARWQGLGLLAAYGLFLAGSLSLA